MKKILTLLILPLMIISLFPVSASAKTKAGIGPSSFFYFFDTTFEKINLFFTFNSEKKALKALEYADERLAEAEKSATKNKPKAVEKAMKGYEEKISLATEKSKELKDEKKLEELLNTVSESTARHQEVLEGVLEKVPDEAKEAILKAIEVSKKGQEEALKQILKLEDENSKLKKEVKKLKEELNNKETKAITQKIEKKENVTEKNEDIEKLKKEIEALKKSQEAQRIAEDKTREKREAETLLVEQRKVEDKKDISQIVTLPSGAIVELDKDRSIVRYIKLPSTSIIYKNPELISKPQREIEISDIKLSLQSLSTTRIDWSTNIPTESKIFIPTQIPHGVSLGMK